MMKMPILVIKAITRPLAVTLSVSLLVAFAACAEAETACTAENSGLGGQPAVAYTELSPPIDKAGCQPHFEIMRTEEELRRAYLAAGARLQGEPGVGNADDALALPVVDFARQSVLVREDVDDQNVSFVVGQAGVLTVGTQGCIGFGTGTCRTQFFMLELAATSSAGTTVTRHKCEDIGCGGVPQSTAGGGQ